MSTDKQIAVAKSWLDFYRISANMRGDHQTQRIIKTIGAALSAQDGWKDRDRLDFLDECNARLNAHCGTTYRWELILNHNVNRLMIGRLAVDLNDAKAHGWNSCREAIDREMTRIAALRAVKGTN